MPATILDTEKRGDFEERVAQGLNAAALTLMTSIGHRTGLFDAMAGAAPEGSAALAERAGLDERYVREWLAAMTVGGVVEYDPENDAYRLPDEHAACLTRAAAPNNLAALTQGIAMLGAVEDRIVDCFRNGGGVPYSEFKGFHRVMEDDSGQSVVPALLDGILPLAPALTERLREGIDALDLGCGSGRALVLMAAAFPRSRFVGFEVSEEALARARRHAAARGVSNVRFVLQDAATMGDREAFDLVCTFDAIHDQADPARVLRNIRRALRPGGVYLMQDINGSCHVHHNLEHPFAPLLYTISCMHCMTVSLAENGAGLGTMWGVETAREMLADAGFAAVEQHELEHDPMNVYFVCPV